MDIMKKGFISYSSDEYMAFSLNIYQNLLDILLLLSTDVTI